ncbi:MAG: hypothetical protein WCH43_15170, partial [Verrucomicrobiota bacterium]
KQGSPDGVSFRLPASAPEARVTGGNVRETTSKVEGDWRIYQVAFQTDLIDRTDFTVDFELPGEGKVSLPAFELLNLERSEGFVIVDNASQYEMQVDPAKLDAAQSSQIPFLPQTSRNARIFRALPGWGLQINRVKLEKDSGRDAFVAWAELTTAIRADGSEWHRATYHLQNRSLQFLPVKLPGGTELASVSVAGENVRADRGKVDGKEVLLVPLIKTKPGDVSYDVDLVYRNQKTGSRFGLTRKALADPEVVGITVERTLWNLYLPEEAARPHFGGNMNEVLAGVNQAEKLEGMLDELKRLNTLVLSDRNSDVSRNAGENFRRLAKSMEDDSGNVDARDADKSEFENKALESQGAYVSKKKREIQEELGRQKQSFEGNRTRTVASGLSSSMLQPRSESKTRQEGQNWSSNSGYVATLPEAAENAKQLDQKEAAGNKLYVNDFVMNVQADRETQKTSSGGSGTPSSGATTVRSGGLSLTTDRVMTESKDALVLGDSQAQTQLAQLQNAQVTQGAVQAGKPDDMPLAARGSIRRAEPQTLQSGNENVKILNSARSNCVDGTNSEESPAPVMSRRLIVDAGATNADFALSAYASDNLSEAGNSPSPGVPALVTAPFGFSGGQAGGGGMQNKIERLQPAGAISLPVDFPLEGRVYHFKKLKSNAQLTL